MVKPLARLVGASELMESPDADPTELAQALRGLAGINRYLGGVRVIRGQLAALLPVFPAPLRILDVGTGFADIPRALVRWARRHKCPSRSRRWIAMLASWSWRSGPARAIQRSDCSGPTP